MANRSNKWSLLGIPDHQGVINVGGRVGAALGPAAFRRCLARMQGRDPSAKVSVLESCIDMGNVTGLGGDVNDNHSGAAIAVRDAHLKTGVSVVVGGGHDHGYSHLKGLREALGGQAKLGCINIDAHLDVRAPAPKPGSGSPFYLALEGRVLEPRHLVEFGVQTQCNAKPLWDYVESKNVPVIPFAKLKRERVLKAFVEALKGLCKRCDAVVVSLDLDAIAEAYAPGVSAPQSDGFTPGEVFAMLEAAAAMREVASLGIFELNPVHDRDDQTARVAATAAFRFIESRFS